MKENRILSPGTTRERRRRRKGRRKGEKPPSSKPPLNLPFCLIIDLFVVLGTIVALCMCGDQMTSSKRQLTTYTKWVPEMEL